MIMMTSAPPQEDAKENGAPVAVSAAITNTEAPSRTRQQHNGTSKPNIKPASAVVKPAVGGSFRPKPLGSYHPEMMFCGACTSPASTVTCSIKTNANDSDSYNDGGDQHAADGDETESRAQHERLDQPQQLQPPATTDQQQQQRM